MVPTRAWHCSIKKPSILLNGQPGLSLIVLWQPGCLDKIRGFPSLPHGRFGLVMDCIDCSDYVGKHYNRTGIACPLNPLFNCDLRYFGLKGMPEYGLKFLGGHFQLSRQVDRVIYY
jgi:hypothetical protein